MLGIAVGERSMLVAEVHTGSSGPEVIKAMEFTYPEGVTPAKDPAAIGSALGQFLKEKGFGARLAVFGLPAKWVLSKQKEVPAIADNLLADTLRLQAESEFSSELGELVYDYAGSGGANPSVGGTSSVLLLAVPKRYIDQINQLAEAARVRVLAVTPFSTAIGASSKGSADAMMLLLGPSGVEFTTQHGGHPSVLRYLGTSADSTPTLMGELRRAATRTGAAGASTREIFIWNDTGADETQIQSIGHSLELGVRDGSLGDLGVSAAPGVMNGRDFATSISLAVLGMAPAEGVPDFLDSRLAPLPEQRIDRRTLLAAAVVVLLVATAGLWYWNIQSRQAAVDQIVKENISNNDARTKAQATVKRIQLAERWHGEKPKFVACLTDLTELAPQTPDIYGTQFSLKDETPDASSATPTPAGTNPPPPKPTIMKGTLKGKATNDNVIFALAQKLMDSKGKFSGTRIESRDRNESKGQVEISFVIEFNYSPK
jgi:hypothetical protein